MFLALDQSDLLARPAISLAMRLDRARQFVDRHRWPLDLDQSGGESDEFDDAWTTYCIVADGDRHLASARLRPAARGSMVERHFPQFRCRAADLLRNGTEVTRFCVSPALTPDHRLQVVSDLLLGLCRHCQRSGVPSFFGVVFPAVARVFRLAGWPGDVLAEAAIDRGRGSLAEWHASETVAWDIQEARARREDRLRLGRQGRSSALALPQASLPAGPTCVSRAA